jgi:hypothetical protein
MVGAEMPVVQYRVAVHAKVLSPSREDLEARQEQLLQRAAMSLDELRGGREAFSLTGDQGEILTELEEIEFLLGR